MTLTKRINSTALPVCLAAMDGCWVYAVAWTFNVIVLSSVKLYPVPEPLLLAGLELAAWGLSAYLLDKTRFSVGVVRWLVGIVGVLACAGLSLATNPGSDITSLRLWLSLAIYSLIISLVLWAFGGYRASERIGFDAVYRNFRLGLIVVFSTSLLATVLAQRNIGPIWDGVGGVALWFFAWSICALALGNRELLRHETGNNSPRFWGPLLAGSLGCIFLIAVISGSFTLQNLFGMLQQLVVGVYLIVAAVVYGVLYAIFWLIAHLPRLPFKLGQRTTPTPTPTPQQQPSSDGGWQKRMQEIQSLSAQGLSPELQGILTAALAVAIVALVAWLVSRSLRRTRKNVVREAMEERESLGSWLLFYSQMKSWLDQLLARFRRVSLVVSSMQEDDLSLLQGYPEWSGTLSVRQIYASLQTLAARLGYPRAPQQTPVEYLSVLSEAMPDLQSDLTSITAAYIEARYGPLPASAPAVLAANNAWKRVKRET